MKNTAGSRKEGKMKRQLIICRMGVVCALVVLVASGWSVALHAGSDFDSDSSGRIIARGGGTTIVEGGTGKPGFIPVLTKIAFYAEKKGGIVSGGFECLALAPAGTTGMGSGDFTVNAMYVTGQVKTAMVQGHTATLTGSATITGLGAGSDVPFKLVVRKGGPGATVVLTTEGSPPLVFREILLEGSFQVFSDRD
jgi:hypothetical protein